MRVILNVTEGGVKDLLHLPFHIGAKRRSTKRGKLLTQSPQKLKLICRSIVRTDV